MSTVIIGGGGDARAAIEALEKASLTMTDTQRNQAEKFLNDFTNFCEQHADDPSTLG